MTEPMIKQDIAVIENNYKDEDKLKIWQIAIIVFLVVFVAGLVVFGIYRLILSNTSLQFNFGLPNVDEQLKQFYHTHDLFCAALADNVGTKNRSIRTWYELLSALYDTIKDNNSTQITTAHYMFHLDCLLYKLHSTIIIDELPYNNACFKHLVQRITTTSFTHAFKDERYWVWETILSFFNEIIIGKVRQNDIIKACDAILNQTDTNLLEKYKNSEIDTFVQSGTSTRKASLVTSEN